MQTLIEPRAFRQVLSAFVTGVTVVTTVDAQGQPHGLTANSFSSVSLDPPLVLVSVDRRNRTHELLTEGEPFVVNVLAEAHLNWSDRFAGRHGDVQHQFDDIPHTPSCDGIPIIDEAPAAFSCRVVAVHEAGDHSLFIGQVVGIDHNPAETPLLFYGGKYRSLQAVE